MQSLIEKKAITDRAQYEKHAPVPDLDAGGEEALRVWNDMGGEIDYAALPWLLERHGVLDVDALLMRLITIRNTLNNNNNNNKG